ncbi:MAG: phenylalanine--tRNA ligase subunit beta [Nitrospirae bacterium]|nr:phenylalanine--tRNA ligase subunit beta [Nitrospirota bacterium]
MLISYNWLKEYIDFDQSPEAIADILTMSGLEVESRNQLPDGDVILGLNVTPNRADALSVIGVARDISAVLKKKLIIPEIRNFENTADAKFKVEIIDKHLCHRYCGIVINGVKLAPSPDWMQKRLNSSGIRPINNIVDITNYVLMEFGQPLHAFDLEKLKGDKIIVRAADKPEAIQTLDGAERTVPAGTLLICDAEGPIALAGVMGGEGSAVADTTTDILIESAWFEPASIRVTSKQTALRSESSFRFERQTDIGGVKKAALRAASLVIEHCGGCVSEVIDNYPNRYTAPRITLSHEKVQSFLGVQISEDEIEGILKHLDFKVERQDNVFIITPPSFRRDIELEADLIEEVARIYGYNNIPSVMPELALSINKGFGAGSGSGSGYGDGSGSGAGVGDNVSDKHKKLTELRHSLRYAGFTETINYSFTTKDDFELLDIPVSDERRNAVTVKNPLQKDYDILRTFLLPSLLKNLKYNISFGAKEVSIYEISTVFFDVGKGFPKERLKLAVLSYSSGEKKLYTDPASHFYRIKGQLEPILSSLRCVNYEFRQSNEDFLENGQSADIFVDDDKVGCLGLLASETVARLDIKTGKPEIAVIEIYLDEIISPPLEPLGYKPFLKYPSIERDLAIVVDEGRPYGDIVDFVKNELFDPERLIESVEIFDHYKGKNIPDDKKSLAFHIVYRARERTLIESEIDTLHAEIVKYIISKTGGALRA